jgi:hypothetical protein
MEPAPDQKADTFGYKGFALEYYLTVILDHRASSEPERAPEDYFAAVEYLGMALPFQVVRAYQDHAGRNFSLDAYLSHLIYFHFTVDMNRELTGNGEWEKAEVVPYRFKKIDPQLSVPINKIEFCFVED